MESGNSIFFLFCKGWYLPNNRKEGNTTKGEGLLEFYDMYWDDISPSEHFHYVVIGGKHCAITIIYRRQLSDDHAAIGVLFENCAKNKSK
jgi:hypothetical protein